MGSHRPLAGITVALSAAALLAGCAKDNPADTATSALSSALSSEQSPESTSTQAESSMPAAPTKAPRTVNWTALQAGDCLAEAVPTDPAVVTVTVVDCSQPHLAEAFLRAPIPVDAALDGTATTECEAGFADYTDAIVAATPYTVTYLIDSDQDRTANNPLPSTVICLLQGMQGQSLTGSAKG